MLQHCTGHITTGSWKGRGNQYIQFVRVLYCKLRANGKQLPAFPLEAVPGIEPRPQRWEARVLPLCHRGPLYLIKRHCSLLSLPHLCVITKCGKTVADICRSTTMNHHGLVQKYPPHHAQCSYSTNTTTDSHSGL